MSKKKPKKEQREKIVLDKDWPPRINRLPKNKLDKRKSRTNDIKTVM